MIRLFKKSKIFVFLIILINTSSLIASQIPDTISTTTTDSDFQKTDIFSKLFNEDGTLSYNAVIKFLEDLENEKLQICSQDDWNKIDEFLAYLARQGIMPDTPDEEKIAIENDIQEDLLGSNDITFQNAFYYSNSYQIIPAIYYDQSLVILRANWISHKLKKTAKFIKEHKKAIIIAAVVVVATVAVVATVVAATTTAAVSAAAATAADSYNNKPKEENKAEHSSIVPNSVLNNSPIALPEPTLQNAFDNQFNNLKNSLTNNSFEWTPNNQFSFNNDNQRIIGSVLAHEALNNIPNIQSYNPDLIIQGHGKIDYIFSTFQTPFYADYKKNSNNQGSWQSNIFYYQGQEALKTKNYDQAIDDFGKALEINPNNHDIYLDRAYAHLERGDFNQALYDYNSYSVNENIEQKSISLSDKARLCQIAIKGMSNGAIKSGKKTIVYAAEVLQDPIKAGKDIYNGVNSFEDRLVNLIYDYILQPIETTKEIYNEIRDTNEWKQLRDTLFPELGDLFERWGGLTLEEKVAMGSKVFGEFCTDFATYAAAPELFAKGVKGTKELVEMAKSFERADKAVLLEAFAGTGGGGSFQEMAYSSRINAGTIAASEKLIEGFSIEKLAEAGKAFDREGLTKSGRALAKHGGREPSVFPKPLGNPEQINLQGQKILESILNNPNSKIINLGEKGFKIYDPEGKGLFYYKDGTLRGFIEAQYEQEF
ncbi:MAG: tetratricopeptide repeat protein [Parachlamydiales bacterium]|jgi:tetratricopeptide (TPR) repeat protein